MQSPPAFGFRSISDRLGFWNFYFIAKLALFAMGLIGFHLLENLAFAAVLFAMAGPKARRWRPWLGVPVAAALLYYDSWLPGFSRVVSQASLVASFSLVYLAELAGRFVSGTVLAVLTVALALYVGISRLVRLDLLVIAAMVAMGLALGPPTPRLDNPATVRGVAPRPHAVANPDTSLADFHRKEAQRAVAFVKPPEDAPAFDVVFLHICSLSWDDLAATGLERHPLLSSFDIVLRRFNTVSTYSGPAAIRFLRAPCGQSPHKSLYAATGARCLLMPDLAQAGLQPQLALNHDGHFDEFLKHVKEQGVEAQPLPLAGIAAPQRSFDDSRIYDDASVLARWIEQRARGGSARAALYYNSVSLHDGNRMVSDTSRKSADTYKERLAKLLDDLDGFMKALEASGRRAVVVMVPEHGAAIRGDAVQIAGLREIPTPAITLAPVGVKVIGRDVRRNGEAVAIADPTSYLAVSHIVSRMLARPPFGGAFTPADYVGGLPVTEFVAETENATVLRRGEAYWIRQEPAPWRELR